MSNTSAEGEIQGSPLRGSTGPSNTGTSNTGSSSKGVTTPKARTNSVVPGLQAEDDARVRGETVVVGRQAKQARKDKHSKEEARVGENNNPTVLEENNNSVAQEGRHKLPPLVIRGPRVEVARRVSGLSRGLRKGRAQRIKNVAKAVADEVARAVLGEQHGNGNSPQTEEEEEQEQETKSARLLEVTVKATISKGLVFTKRPCPPRPRSARCDELLPVWKTKALRSQAKLVLKGVHDEQLRQAAGARISLQLGKDLPMVVKVQLLPDGEEMLRLEVISAIHQSEPSYFQEKVWRFPFRAACKVAQVLSWEEEEEHRLNLYEEARWSLESATLLFIASLVARCGSGEGEELGLGDVEDALSQFPLIAAGMAMTGAPAKVKPSMLWPTIILEQEDPGATISGLRATSPEPSDQLGTSSRDSSMVLSDDEYNKLEGEGEVDPLQGVKEEVAEHVVLQAMYGQPPVVHLPNPYYEGSSDEEVEQDQGQVVEMTEEGVVLVTLSEDEEGE